MSAVDNIEATIARILAAPASSDRTALALDAHEEAERLLAETSGSDAQRIRAATVRLVKGILAAPQPTTIAQWRREQKQKPPQLGLATAQADFDTARDAFYSAQEALCEAAEAWIKAKVLDLYPTAATLVMQGEAGEEFNTTWRAAYALNAEGGIIAKLNDRDETDPDDGPIAWAEVTDMLPELNGPDGYMGETEIDLLA